MRLSILILLVCLSTACSPWHATEPTTVVLRDDLSDDQVEAVISAVEDLNARVGGELARAVFDDGRLIQRHRILVTSKMPGPGELAVCNRNPFRAEIRLGRGTDRATIQHELLHAFGVKHSDDPNDLMYERAVGGQTIPEATIEYLREKLDG